MNPIGKILLNSRKTFYNFYKNLKASQGEIFFLLLIFIFSFFVRYIGLTFGYPLNVHSDEPVSLIPVYNMTKEMNLNPNTFQRPDQIMYLLNYIFLNIISFFKTGQNFAYAFPTNKFLYYVYSRGIIVTFGSLIPLVAYKIGKESSIDYSIPAALFFSFFPIFVRHSHYSTPDIPITFFTLIVVLFSTRYIRKKEEKYLYLATVFSSINTAEKYPGLISFGLIIFSILWVQTAKFKEQPQKLLNHFLKESFKFFGFYLASLYIIAPNLFIHYGKVIEQITKEARDTHLGHDGLGWIGNMIFYLNNFLNYSNVLIVIFIILGLIGLIKTKKYEVLPCLYGLIYWLILSKVPLHWERWGLPMYTAPLLIAAFGFSFLWDVLRKRGYFNSILILLLTLTIIWSLIFSLSISINLTYTDTRVAALHYCEEVGITKENTVYEGATPFLPSDPRTFHLSKVNENTKYIMLSSSMYERYYKESIRYQEQVNEYKTVMSKYPLIKTFSPTPSISTINLISWINDIEYYIQRQLGNNPSQRFTGPTILIYKVK